MSSSPPEPYEIEIRRAVGTKFQVVRKETYDNFTEARRAITRFNESQLANSRLFAAGPWPPIGD